MTKFNTPPSAPQNYATSDPQGWPWGVLSEANAWDHLTLEEAKAFLRRLLESRDREFRRKSSDGPIVGKPLLKPIFAQGGFSYKGVWGSGHDQD